LGRLDCECSCRGYMVSIRSTGKMDLAKIM
jgi:hypothetical protein